MPEIIKLPQSKRIFDVVVTVVLFLLLSPLFAFIVIWIILEWIFIKDSRGSFLYMEKRVSQGKKFNFYKWRTFKTKVLDEALNSGRVIQTTELQSDPKNLTYYGRFLKRIYMDELPQLWNVLKGDMTLVGPRPTNLENSEYFKKSGDFSREIMICGLTGPFQAQKGHAILSQTNLDKEYADFLIKNPGWKIILRDLKIIFQTIIIVLEAKGI